jgi:hypothetical protein
MKNDHCIDVCNSLLRGEQSAVATYTKAITSFEDEKMVPAPLRKILEDHREAVLTLTENIRSMGGEPSHESGVWGSFAETVQGAANLLGDKAALASLKAGETAGREGYESALKDNDVMPECKQLIQSTLLPSTQSHIEELDRLAA